MSACLSSIPQEIVEFPISNCLTVEAAVELAKTSMTLRAHMVETFESIGQIAKNQLSKSERELQTRSACLKDLSLNESKEMDAAAEVSGRYFEAYRENRGSHEEFRRLRNELAEQLAEILAPITKKHLPNELRSNFYLELSSGYLTNIQDIRFLYKLKIEKRLTTKLVQIRQAKDFCAKYLSNQDGEIILKVAKIAKLFPRLAMKELRQLDKLLAPIHHLQFFVTAIKVDQLHSSTRPADEIVLSLLKPEENSDIDQAIQETRRLSFGRGASQYLRLGLGYSFLARFTHLTNLTLNDTNLSQLPRAAQVLPLLVLDISSNDFRALPTIPQTLWQIVFHRNPISIESEDNDNIHGKIIRNIFEFFHGKTVLPIIYAYFNRTIRNQVITLENENGFMKAYLAACEYQREES